MKNEPGFWIQTDTHAIYIRSVVGHPAPPPAAQCSRTSTAKRRKSLEYRHARPFAICRELPSPAKCNFDDCLRLGFTFMARLESRFLGFVLARHSDHSKNLSGRVRIKFFAKSFILLVYEVLARRSRERKELTSQPRRCRSDKIIARILAELS
jgi:hypothetical protein